MVVWKPSQNLNFSLVLCLIVILRCNTQGTNHIIMRKSYHCYTVYNAAGKYSHIFVGILQNIMCTLSSFVCTLSIHFIINCVLLKGFKQFYVNAYVLILVV